MPFVGGCTVVCEVAGVSMEYVVPLISRPQAQAQGPSNEIFVLEYSSRRTKDS